MDYIIYMWNYMYILYICSLLLVLPASTLYTHVVQLMVHVLCSLCSNPLHMVIRTVSLLVKELYTKYSTAI